MKKRVLAIKSLIIILCMLFQNISILASNEVQSYYPQLTMPAKELSIPDQVIGVDSYIEIPVYNNGNVVEQVTVHLNKKASEDKIYDGDASFKVKGYAYKNKGSSEVILGIAIGYYGYEDPNNPNQTPQWYEQFIEAVKVSGSQSSATVEECKALMRNSKYSIRIDSINYQDQTQDARVLPVVESYKDNVLIGTWGSRATEKHVALTTFENTQDIKITRIVTPVEGQKNQWDVKVQVKNLLSQSKVIDTVIVLDVPNSNQAQGICKNTLDNVLNPLLTTPGSKVSLVLEGEEIANYIGPTSIDDSTLSKLVKDKIKENNKTNSDLFNANSIQKARAILSANKSSNKSIVIVSYEGANCKGKSNGKNDCVELTDNNKEAIVTQMKTASAEGITIYTFAAHGKKGENKAHTSPLQGILKDNTNGKFYATEFAETSLKADSKEYMTEIATLINTKQSGQLTNNVYTDKIAAQFKVISSNLQNTSINTNQTEIVWNIGQLNQGEEKTLIYRIEMKDGDIGTPYLISKEVKLQYTDEYGKSTEINNIPNPAVKAAWAKLTVEHKDDRDTILTRDGNGSYTFDVWVNVENKSNVQVNPSSLMTPSTMELKAEGTVTIANYVTIPNYQCLGRRISTGEYSLTQPIILTKLNTSMALFYRKNVNTLTVGLKVVSGIQTKDTYKATFLDTNKIDTMERILKGSELIVEKNAYIQVEVEGFDLEVQGYKIIKDTNKPTLPLSGENWISLGVLNDSEKNRQENYPDMILDQPGYISTRHYDYSKTNSTREATFGNPIGENLVIQKAKGTGNKVYSAVSGANAFFENSNITSEGGANKAVKFWGYLKPTGIKAGEFNLGSNSDDGAYGYVMLGDERKVFVEDWQIAAAYTRSNGVNIRLEPGKVYPIYMEWYEGQPVCKAFLPSYKEVGGEWKTIPQEWFYPSSNTEPGDVNTAYFVPKTTSSIPLGETPGTYYVVVDVKDKAGNERQLSYGPIKIEANDLANMGSNSENNKNVIIPTSLSNIYWETTLPDEYKDVSYTIDLSTLVNEKINDMDKLIDLNLNQSEIKKYIGIAITPKPSDYKVSTDGSHINIQMNKSHANTLISGKQTITVYIRTDMGNKTNYTNYKDNYLEKTREIEVKTYGKKKYYEQEVQEDGTIIQRECYIENSDGSAPEISSIKIDMKFKEIPIIN